MKIDTRLAERLQKINPSATLAITSKAKKLRSEGKDVVTFAAGEPDFDTPDFIKDAAYEAIKCGFTKYTPTTGIPDLKNAICDKFKKDNGLVYVPSQVIVSCGAKHSIFNALFVLVEKGDEVLIPSPYWVSYPEMVNLCEATPRFIKTSARNKFKMTTADLERAITAKTKVLILNSPSNPTGCVYTKEELEAIAKICVAKRIFVIADEIYEKIIFDGQRHVSIASFSKEIYDLTITVNGLSKSHSMTGWRIGYVGAPQDIADAISKFQDHSTSNPTSIAQKAAVAALRAPDDFCVRMCAEFEKRRDYIVKRLSSIKQFNVVRPEGAFYVFCGIKGIKLDSLQFAVRLLDEALVAVIPGVSFGWDEFVRFSFATNIEQIEKGVTRIEEWLQKNNI
ncbi:MAG TPA: pyridoxal phosphate-dependent aminotransferase [Candidatus Omnitrophota bacterium]|nr:pyridoxal phosphate-dependent aminotransferase [Candidatus Omnitrophota bacterium]HPT07556.1 pyridoxal phosphate-dependent aminotransferase [Candidatus Omnitrophota bacterium]